MSTASRSARSLASRPTAAWRSWPRSTAPRSARTASSTRRRAWPQAVRVERRSRRHDAAACRKGRAGGSSTSMTRAVCISGGEAPAERTCASMRATANSRRRTRRPGSPPAGARLARPREWTVDADAYVPAHGRRGLQSSTADVSAKSLQARASPDFQCDTSTYASAGPRRARSCWFVAASSRSDARRRSLDAMRASEPLLARRAGTSRLPERRAGHRRRMIRASPRPTERCVTSFASRFVWSFVRTEFERGSPVSHQLQAD